MIRIEGIQTVAARLAAGLKSTKTVEASTPFRPRRRLQRWSPGPQQASDPIGQEAVALGGVPAFSPEAVHRDSV
jgi:hypothetical protein